MIFHAASQTENDKNNIYPSPLRRLCALYSPFVFTQSRPTAPVPCHTIMTSISLGQGYVKLCMVFLNGVVRNVIQRYSTDTYRNVSEVIPAKRSDGRAVSELPHKVLNQRAKHTI